MLYSELEELHYIAHFDNVASIMKLGILPYNKAKRIQHTSFAMEEIQERRGNVIVPGAGKLHDYVNLYINARNTALFKRKEMHEKMAIFRINKDILRLPGVIITDRNASSSFVRFHYSPDGLRYIDRIKVFARYWTHPEDQAIEFEHKSCMCAEVLVPGKVETKYLLGAYCSNSHSANYFRKISSNCEVTINPYIFFQSC